MYQQTLTDLLPESATDSTSSLADEDRGAVFTKREVVEFILDLVGYTSDRPLYQMQLLEPSFGRGEFVLVAAARLFASLQGRPYSFESIRNCICAIELHLDSYESTRHALIAQLIEAGSSLDLASRIASAWLKQADYLLCPFDSKFDFAVGNPPYVRQERVPPVLMAEYRARYQTVYDRADLYIPFIERSLTLLKAGGKLGFICADRWMKNRYGAPLRRFVIENFHVEICVDMVDADAFHEDVSAYPAVTIIRRGSGHKTRVAKASVIDREHLESLARDFAARDLSSSKHAIGEIVISAKPEAPWILHASDKTELVRRLEAEFPAIEDTGCKIGIGVATGADSVFIGHLATLPVEQDRKIALATTKDIASGQVVWGGLGVVNPFADDGELVNLNEFPLLREYFESHKDQIANRHCARKIRENWYRTIDKIVPALARTPKLLIPDIKGHAQVVYENGSLYPHHNLYFITSSQWDLRALQAVLLSGIARLFVATYTTKLRGGYLRFQAQYLRRIHIPRWSDIPDNLRISLIAAGKDRNIEACNSAAAELYRLTNKEKTALCSV
jgi:hypothetical protein